MTAYDAAQLRQRWVALLKSLLVPHDDETYQDHKWTRCRKCLAREALDHRGTDAALQAVLDYIAALEAGDGGPTR